MLKGPGKAPAVLRVNGVEYTLPIAPNQTLLDVLRDELALTGTKKVCDHGECGAYPKIFKAVQKAATRKRGESDG